MVLINNLKFEINFFISNYEMLNCVIIIMIIMFYELFRIIKIYKDRLIQISFYEFIVYSNYIYIYIYLLHVEPIETKLDQLPQV